VHHPDAQIWIVRIGSRHVRRSGVFDVQNIITISAKSATSCLKLKTIPKTDRYSIDKQKYCAVKLEIKHG